MKKITIISALFLLIQPVLRAQLTVETDTLKNYILEEITVKSPKYNMNIFDIPAAASMLPERLIENNKIENLTDISAFVPNFFMPDYGSKLTSPVYIRGVGNRINTPSIGLYVDYIPYFEKSAFNFDFYEIEQIEVLRGSQGTLYGRNAMGGLINIMTRKPEKERKTSISADYGNYSQVRAGISHNQPLGEKFIILANLNQINNSGFYENKFNNNRVDKLNSYSGRVKMQFTPSEKFTASLNVQYEDSKQGGYPYALFNKETNKVADINYEYKSYYNRQLLSSGLILNYFETNFDVRSVTSFQSINDLQVVDQDFTPKSLFYANQDQKLNMFAQEINIQSKNNKTYGWLFGFFGFTQAIDRSVTVEYAPDGLIQYNLPFDEYYITRFYDNINSGAAIFHQSTLYFGDFSITAGIRADYEKATLNYIQDNFTNEVKNNAEQTASKLDFFEILPKIAFKYSISEYLTPYATIAKGYNSGGFNDTFESDRDRSFNPEHSWNYEAGVKAKWLQQRIYTNLAIFYIDWANQQIYQTVPSGTGSMLTNAGKSESKGVELEFKIIPAKNIETWLAAGYNNAKFIKYVKDSNVDYSGKHIPYVPKFSFNLGANYLININSSWLDNIRFNVTYNGIGKHYWNEDNIAYQNYYGLLNHRITFEKDNITFSFWGKNILNENYNSFYFQALGNSYAQIGKPASLGVNMKVSF
ncbi:MAG: TonB-dependent receptor [Bacteroidales bacterium]|jgi:outer membrane receptor protein involved in Fe transport|nr:TonB-dependent receptor [Bacteroidales bacterium]